MKLTVGHFLQALTAYQATGRETAVVDTIIDSREATTGTVFVAFRGERVDGHDYVGQALAQGAIAALIERPVAVDCVTIDTRQPLPPTVDLTRPFCLLVENTMVALQAVAKFWRGEFDVRITAVVGSVGKTTTKELIYTVLSQRYRTLKSAGNMNNEIGLPLTLLKLQKAHERVVLEMGMYAQGEIATLCDIAQPVVGVLTIIGAVHMERLGSMEAIVAAKQEVVEALPADGLAILNKDDARVMSMAAHTKASVFTYGLDSSADLWADNIQTMGLDGVRFTMHHQRDHLNVQVSLLGRHNVHTCLRAAAVGLAEGLRWEEIITGLKETSAQVRLLAVPGPQDSLIIDDTYNANPASMFAALNLLKDLNGRRVAVLGDMLELGPVEQESHALVGRRVAEVVQLLIVVGRRGAWIGEAALMAGMSPLRVVMVDEAPDAIPILFERIVANDVILIKGSWGMRMDRIVTALGRAV